MHPRLLKTFLAVARSRNITRAAQEVHLAQSSVSDQILSLEAELGTSLFVRSKLGLTLTPAGRTFKDYSEKLLAIIEEARAAVEATAGETTAGPLAIGALETIAANKLPSWLAAFRIDHPGIDLRLSVAGSGELMRHLEAGEIHVAFCFDKNDHDQRFAARKICEEPLVLVGSKDCRGQTHDGLPSLAARSFVVTEAGCVYRHLFDKAFLEAGLVAPRPAAEVGSIRAIIQLVAKGAGLALVPRFAVADALLNGGVVEIPWPGGPTPSASLIATWRRRRVLPPAVELLLGAINGGFTPVKSAGAHPRHAARSRS